MASKQLFLLLLSALFFVQVSSYKILILALPPARSHYNLGKAAADVLHERNHEVTFVSAFKNDKKTYREVFLEEMMSIKNDSLLDFDSMTSRSALAGLSSINRFVVDMINVLMKDPGMNKLYNDKSEKFDLVILEHFMNNLLIGLGVRFNCPVILISPMILTSSVAKLTGNPKSLETVPSIFLALPAKMNLLERTMNVGFDLAQEIIYWWLLNPNQKALYEEYFKAESQKVAFKDLASKISLIMINSHPSMTVARPLLPNSIDIGGYHIGQVKPLPQDLQKILDNAKNGAVYFSMGSNLKSSKMSLEVRQSILKALSKLKETVLWKFEEDLPGKPDNVIIRKWMPQDAILAHPNVKLFISHGGLLSCIEAVHHGVAMITIPIFGDQKANARAIVDRSQGLTLDYNNITENSLSSTLNEILSNPKYQQNAKRINRLFHDRPMRPRDLLAFYAEHVIRSGGAAHLSPPRISRCSELLLDVFGLLLIPPSLVFIFVIMACRRCFKTKNTNKKEKDTKEKGGKQKKN